MAFLAPTSGRAADAITYGLFQFCRGRGSSLAGAWQTLVERFGSPCDDDGRARAVRVSTGRCALGDLRVTRGVVGSEMQTFHLEITDGEVLDSGRAAVFELLRYPRRAGFLTWTSHELTRWDVTNRCLTVDHNPSVASFMLILREACGSYEQHESRSVGGRSAFESKAIETAYSHLFPFANVTAPKLFGNSLGRGG